MALVAEENIFEDKVFELMWQRKNNTQIAIILGLSPDQFKRKMAKIYKKYKVDNREDFRFEKLLRIFGNELK